MEQSTHIKLGELFDEDELGQIAELLKHNKDADLKAYLNEPIRRLRLVGKGIEADYLYYVLQYEKTKFLTRNN
jgi:hypothetical protein